MTQHTSKRTDGVYKQESEMVGAMQELRIQTVEKNAEFEAAVVRKTLGFPETNTTTNPFSRETCRRVSPRPGKSLTQKWKSVAFSLVQ
jgi:hypothetical protein